MHAPKSWASVVAGDRAKDPAPKQDTIDGAVGAASVCRSSVPPMAPVAPVYNPKLAPEASVPPHATPGDFANMMTAEIAAALKPLREKLEAAIIPMKRTIEALQAEFVSIREEKTYDCMHTTSVSAAAMEQDTERLRAGPGA